MFESGAEMRPIISILRRISQISDHFPFDGKENFRKEITTLLSQINCKILEIQLPSTMPPLPVQVLCGNVYRNWSKFDSGIFAFPKTGDKLPLHDHPKMEGFIKIIKGKLLVTSFSLLDFDEERKVREENGEEKNQRIRPAKFQESNWDTVT
uniref:2-aminoethanethiol dioxygenase n=1 Tax=Panagrolaimus superbus TaxID=310955 RepID=A0A914Z8U5_9BILA